MQIFHLQYEQFRRLGSRHHVGVDVEINEDRNRIILKGLAEDVNNIVGDIYDVFRKMEKASQERDQAKLLYGMVGCKMHGQDAFHIKCIFQRQKSALAQFKFFILFNSPSCGFRRPNKINVQLFKDLLNRSYHWSIIVYSCDNSNHSFPIFSFIE